MSVKDHINLHIAVTILFRELTLSRANRKARVQVAICTIHATIYANWYGMKVATMKRRTPVVMMRLWGDIDTKAGAVSRVLI